MQVNVQPGLSDPEFACTEAEFGFTFPPSSPQECPSVVGSPTGAPHLPSRWKLPLVQIVGPRPSEPESALQLAMATLRRASVLIPIFNHCYVPCSPSLAGNPVFFADDDRIFCCGSDLSDFFERESLFRRSPPKPITLRQQRSTRSKSTGSSLSDFSARSSDAASHKTPPSVEFWSEAAVMDLTRMNSSSSSTE
ncbi:hypothetical protein SAY87_022652 [Trapa incisa]|uniref:Uncharacterized protein n=1 Tax=Trapa incisa TaxID=236973 RepID=A0AAN7K446_9MYRT|nr:hypothetical protein SAY87_022652 [Trapa incisa]